LPGLDQDPGGVYRKAISVVRTLLVSNIIIAKGLTYSG